VDDTDVIRFKDNQMVGHLVDEVAIMADEKNCAIELFQGLFEGVTCPEVEVICRLVEDQEIGPRGCQTGEGHPTPLTTAEVFDPCERTITGDAEFRQKITALLLDEVIRHCFGGKDGIHRREVFGQTVQVLIEITDDHVVSAGNPPGVWWNLTQQTP